MVHFYCQQHHLQMLFVRCIIAVTREAVIYNAAILGNISVQDEFELAASHSVEKLLVREEFKER